MRYLLSLLFIALLMLGCRQEQAEQSPAIPAFRTLDTLGARTVFLHGKPVFTHQIAKVLPKDLPQYYSTRPAAYGGFLPGGNT